MFRTFDCPKCGAHNSLPTIANCQLPIVIDPVRGMLLVVHTPCPNCQSAIGNWQSAINK